MNNFDLPVDKAKALLPQNTATSFASGFTEIADRADSIAMSGRPAGTRSNKNVDEFEAKWLHQRRNDLQRMFSASAECADLLFAMTKATEPIAAPPDAGIPYPLPGLTEPDRVELSAIATDNPLVRAVAERGARTSPGADDGGTQWVYRSDLEAAASWMDPESEYPILRLINSRFFRCGLVDGESKSETYELPVFQDGAVSAAIERVKQRNVSISGNRAIVNQTRVNRGVVVRAKPGSKVLFSAIGQPYQRRQTVVVVPEDGVVSFSTNGNALAGVGVMVVEPSDEVGVPMLAAKVVLAMPPNVQQLDSKLLRLVKPLQLG